MTLLVAGAVAIAALDTLIGARRRRAGRASALPPPGRAAIA